VDSAETFDSRELMDAVWSEVVKLYGEYGASRAGLAFIDYDVERKLAIVRVANTAVDMVRAALVSITKIGTKPIAIHVLTVSGTIKALIRKAKQ
jgi:RNase P/RNase MRP subunit POP5